MSRALMAGAQFKEPRSSHIEIPMPKEKILEPKRKKRQKLLANLVNHFNEFSSNTSIHGFKYLTSNKGCTLERIWWVSILCLCIYSCATYIKCILEKRNKNPVFVTLNPTPMNIWDVPFPAITICPDNKILQDKYNITYYSHKYRKQHLNQTELKNFMDAKLFCDGFNRKFRELPEFKHYIDSVDFFLKNAPSLEDILDLCLTDLGNYECHYLFSPIFTDIGLCYSFNMLDRSDLFKNLTDLPQNHVRHPRIVNWSHDNNYMKTLNETYPRRSRRASDSLFLNLKSSRSAINKLCGKYQQFKIIFHHPADAPVLSNRHISLLKNQSYKVWIKPELATTSPNLQYYDPDKRGCYFSDERQLKYFKRYTETNCKLECFANYTIDLCGCTPYYLPHEINSKLCGLAEDKCKDNAKELFFLDGVQDSCGCLPSCTSVTYNEEVTPERKLSSASDNFTYTQIHISFKHGSFRSLERNELFSSTDFFASCGGLFSLFTGFSVVSFAEIIYFLSLKWMCSFGNFGKRFG